MLEISNVRLPLDAGLPDGQRLVVRAAAHALKIPDGDISQVKLLKRSVDARKKATGDVHFVAMLAVELKDPSREDALLKRAKGAKRHVPYQPLEIPRFLSDADPRPIVVGTGPAGLFAALCLARAGLRPLVLERGGCVEERVSAVEAFDAGGPLDVHTNIQFGEGGAGTFSDGKLTTNVKSPLLPHVLHWFVDAGAPEEILWKAKPHIGTDLLVDIVRTMRHQIEEAGGEVRFHTQLEGIQFEGGRVKSVTVRDTRQATDGQVEAAADAQVAEATETQVRHIPASRVILACGHSARDTFAMLHDAGLDLEQKPFSVGVRIEHKQKAIDRAQYGKAAGHPALGAADYKLAVHLANGRGVYTFCMCPGGQVVCAASEEGGVCVNGMSRFARDGQNANSAVLVGVGPEDFGSDHPLAGVELQRRMEQAAYRAAIEAGGTAYQAPAQTVGDFLESSADSACAEDSAVSGSASGKGCESGDRASAKGSAGSDCVPTGGSEGSYRAPTGGSAGFGRAYGESCESSRLSSSTRIADRRQRGKRTVRPTYARGVAWSDLHECLPPFVSEALAEALPLLDKRLRGFADPAAVMTGVEARSSSPVRIVRGKDFQAHLPEYPEVPSGLYPCGEGAGYAGGITSAAIDGLRVALAIVDEMVEESGRV